MHDETTRFDARENGGLPDGVHARTFRNRARPATGAWLPVY